jgi:hypothetical protein
MLQSIENGAQTLFDIVSRTYCDVDRKLWIPASFNVHLHVEHLNSQHKLPKVSEIVLTFCAPLLIQNNRPARIICFKKNTPG